ncbi:MAG: hydroxyethylthiazole kinase [Pseudomonadota bacterium]|nr:hydroxyethylthiazole kinase [Pseudomonadota bacterium]
MNTRPADFSAAQAVTSLTQFRSASPTMVVDPEEAAQFSVVADALLINGGTLERTRAEAMRAEDLA